MTKRFSEDDLASLACSDGIHRTVHIWGSSEPNAVLLCVHGGLAHGGDFVTTGLYFKSHGFTTVSLDLPGHDGQKRVYVPSFDTFLKEVNLFLDWVRQRYPNLPIFCVGHSMGGLILAHFGLRHPPGREDRVQGYVFSSPYFVSAIKVPTPLRILAGLLSTVTPHLKAPLDDFVDRLTHDSEITARHRADEQDHVRATEITARFGHELIKAQSWIKNNFPSWQHPLLVIVAGDDALADAQATREFCKGLNDDIVTVVDYPDNYHENFNELNRDEIFGRMLAWFEGRI